VDEVLHEVEVIDRIAEAAAARRRPGVDVLADASGDGFDLGPGVQGLLEARHVEGERRRVGLHLGEDRRRPRLWLEEYYFGLTCYGVYAGRFPTMNRPELLGLYVSAGVAAARFLWNREAVLDETGSGGEQS
jgi:hypothetical protein